MHRLPYSQFAKCTKSTPVIWKQEKGGCIRPPFFLLTSVFQIPHFFLMYAVMLMPASAAIWRRVSFSSGLSQIDKLSIFDMRFAVALRCASVVTHRHTKTNTRGTCPAGWRLLWVNYSWWCTSFFIWLWLCRFSIDIWHLYMKSSICIVLLSRFWTHVMGNNGRSR